MTRYQNSNLALLPGRLAEMVFRDLPITERVKQIAALAS